MSCIDAPCCGCCDFSSDIASPELAEEMDQDEMDRDRYDDNEPFDFRTDAEADADVLASAGLGTDEDYGCYDGAEEF